MKGLSLTQPWATLVAIGAKRIETRSWHTSQYEGRPRIAIHASKGYPADCRDLVRREPFKTTLEGQDLPLGAIVAVADLVGCGTTEAQLAAWQAVNGRDLGTIMRTGMEYNFGDYSAGRWCFYLDNVQQLRQPVMAKGALGFWTLPLHVETMVQVQLEGLTP